MAIESSEEPSLVGAFLEATPQAFTTKGTSCRCFGSHKALEGTEGFQALGLWRTEAILAQGHWETHPDLSKIALSP